EMAEDKKTLLPLLKKTMEWDIDADAAVKVVASTFTPLVLDKDFTDKAPDAQYAIAYKKLRESPVLAMSGYDPKLLEALSDQAAFRFVTKLNEGKKPPAAAVSDKVREEGTKAYDNVLDRVVTKMLTDELKKNRRTIDIVQEQLG